MSIKDLRHTPLKTFILKDLRYAVFDIRSVYGSIRKSYNNSIPLEALIIKHLKSIHLECLIINNPNYLTKEKKCGIIYTMKKAEGGAKMKREKKIENFLRKLLSLFSLINHNITFKDFSIIVGDKKVDTPHGYIVIVKEMGDVDIEIKNANWEGGYIRTVLNVVGNYDVDVFKNEDGVVINRIYAKDGKCLVQVKYIIYEEGKGYRTLRYLYIVKNNNKQQEV